MPLATTLEATVTTTAETSFPLPIDLAVTGAASSSLEVNLSLSAVLASIIGGTELGGVGSGVYSAGEPFRRIGVKVEIDSGAGFAEIDLDELGAHLSIEEDLDNITGGDRLSFTLLGPDYSPVSSNLLRGRRPVRVTGILDAGGGERSEIVVFNGFTHEAGFDLYPPVSRVTAFDTGSKFSETLISWNEDPGHGKTRKDLLVDICTEYGIALGEIDLGPFGKTELQKPISVAEVPILEFLTEWLSPCDVRIWFSGGKFNAVRYRSGDTVERTISAAQLCVDGGAINPPDIQRPTKVTVTASSYQSLDPTGTRTAVTIESVTREYTRQRSVAKMAVGTGTVTEDNGGDGDVTGDPQTMETSRIITRRTFQGSLLVRSDVEEWGWYARRVAARQVSVLGVVEPLAGLWGESVYQYADGSWRAEPSERWRPIRQTIVSKALDADNYVVSERGEAFFYRWIRASHATIDISGDESQRVSRPITEQGETLVAAGEQWWGNYGEGPFTDPHESTVTKFSRDGEGFLTKVTTETSAQSAGALMGSTKLNAKVYGVETKSYYKENRERVRLVSTLTETYEQLDDSLYVLTEVETLSEGGPGGGDYTERRSRDVIGVGPRAEKLEPQEVSEEYRISSTDSVREPLNGEISVYLHNEYCENESELTNVAEAALREAAAIEFQLEIPFDWATHKGQWVQVVIPDVGLDHKAYVSSVVKVISPDGFRQRLTCMHYPAEVA